MLNVWKANFSPSGRPNGANAREQERARDLLHSNVGENIYSGRIHSMNQCLCDIGREQSDFGGGVLCQRRRLLSSGSFAGGCGAERENWSQLTRGQHLNGIESTLGPKWFAQPAPPPPLLRFHLIGKKRYASWLISGGRRVRCSAGRRRKRKTFRRTATTTTTTIGRQSCRVAAAAARKGPT